MKTLSSFDRQRLEDAVKAARDAYDARALGESSPVKTL